MTLTKHERKQWSGRRIAGLIEFFNRVVYDFIDMRLPGPMRPHIEHTERSVQVENCRAANSEMFRRGGMESIEEYHRENCRLHTGMEPHELKLFGAKLGLKARDRSSGREVARKVMPATACAMSLADYIVQQGYDLQKAAMISKRSVVLFDVLLRMGFHIKPSVR